jgi:prophage antirepressor-like protein
VHHFAFEGDSIRVVIRDGARWFVLADVCRIVGIGNPGNAAGRRENEEMRTASVDALGGPQSQIVLPEAGLYVVVLTSRKQKARRFRRWVTGEVLPAIRRTGAYIPARDEPVEALVLRAVLALQEALSRQEAALAAAQPKVAALERLSGAAGAVSITETAKALGIGPKALMDWLLRNLWTCQRDDSKRPAAYQRTLDRGRRHHRKATNPGTVCLSRVVTQVLVTPRCLAELAQRVEGACLAGADARVRHA